MRTQVVHCKTSPYDVMIDRRTIYGNPFVMGRDGDRDQVIEKCRLWLLGVLPAPDGRMAPTHDQIEMLRGLRLGCWCKPKACHGDLYVAILEGDGI